MRLTFTGIFLLFTALISAQSNSIYERLIDSADIYVLEDARKALQFLDSIPTPIKKFVNGRVGEYYLLQGHAYDREKNQSKVYGSYLLSLRNAEIENDYDTAGDASLELFSNLYFVKQDSTAFKYLDSAKKFYTLSGNENGLVEVSQMPAYVAFLAHEYEESNALILADLDQYKNVADDAYYYLFANFMLASNYIHLNDDANANKYLHIFRSLKTNPTIASFNYNSYEAALNICMSHLHLKRKQIDSTLKYLSNAKQLRDLFSLNSVGEYYSLYAEALELAGKNEESHLYLDSIQIYQQKLLNDNINASLEINDNLLDSEEALHEQTVKVQENENRLLLLALLLLGLLIVFVLVYKKYKTQLIKSIHQKKDYSQLQTKNEKLKVRTHELEFYITDIKNQVKQIASIGGEDLQKEKIRGLYRTINADSANLKNSEEYHLNVLKQLNEPFFLTIKKDHPDLSDTDFLVCYYLKLGFMNKEIAFFLERSLRAIESQRYRISKKMNLKSSKDLLTYLNDNY